MRLVESPRHRSPDVREPGTYRLACGHLLHCRPVAGGALLVLAECAAPCPTAASSVPGMPVRISDDPDWPDGHTGRVALLAFD